MIKADNKWFRVRFVLAICLAMAIALMGANEITRAFGDKATLSSATANTTCKIIRSGTTYYYSSLVEAVEGSQSGDTIEIFKSHSLTSSIDTSGKNLTIQNIANPSDDSENPGLNGSTSNPPVMTFGQSTRLLVNSDVTLKGVILDGGGDRTGGGGTHRSESGIYVGSSRILTIEDGEAGTLSATSTVIRNFTNDSEVPTDAKSGGALYVDGTVNFNSGTITGCVGVKRSYDVEGNENLGGGAVAAIMSGGTFNFSGGTITLNGLFEQGSHGACPTVVKGGTFNMTGGLATENYGNHGGFLIAVADTTSAVNITGGTISNNKAYWDGGALFIGERAGGTSNCLVGGTAVISGNVARRNAGAISLRNCGSLTLSGTSTIRDNSGGSETTPINYGAAIEGYDYDSEGTLTIVGNPVVYNNTTGGTTEADVNIGSTANLLVGDVGTEARVGICFADSMASSRSAGAQFATANGKNASAIALLDGVFCNTADMKYVSAAGSSTAIVWAESLCKVVQNKSDIVGPRAITSLTALAYFCQSVNMDYVDDNVITVQMLVSEYTLTSEVYIQLLSSDRHVKLATAKSGATDGYPYRGDPDAERRQVRYKTWL